MAKYSSDFRSARRRRNFLRVNENRAVVTVFLAFLTVIVSGIGWGLELKPTSAAEWSEFLAEVVSSFARDPSEMSGKGELISIGNFLGLLTTISGAFLIATVTLGQTLSSWWTKHFRRGHTIVIGQTPLALRLAQTFRDRGANVQHVVPEDALNSSQGASSSLAVGYSLKALFHNAGLGRARRVIIDVGGDAETVALAKPIYTKLSQLQLRTMPDISLRISDSVLIDALSDTITKIAPNVRRPVIFNENYIVAQEALARLPLFRVASALGQTRVHALIVGFGDFGQRLFDQVMLTSLAGDLESPLVTVIDRHAVDCENTFRAKRPAVMNSLDVAMIELDVGYDPLDDGRQPHGLAQLIARNKKIPVTAIFLALSNTSDTLMAIMLLRRLRERQDILKVPVFYLSRTDEGDVDIMSESWSEQTPDKGFISMTLTDEILYEQIAEPEKRTTLARHLHEVYRRSENIAEEADTSWENMAETYHRSNIRAADHLPAKLWTLGISSSSKSGVISLNDEDRAYIVNLSGKGNNDVQLLALAQLEHKRWMVDRKLDGWRYATKKDGKLHTHNLLVPWEQLSNEDQEKDFQQVRTALRSLIEKGSGH